MDTVSYHKYLVQSAAGGVGFYAFNNMFNGGATQLRLFEKMVPTWVAGAGMGLASALVSEGVHHWVLPHIHVSKKMENTASAIVNPGTSAITWLLVARLGNVDFAKGEMTQLLAFGAITEFVGNYAQKVFLSEDADAFKF